MATLTLAGVPVPRVILGTASLGSVAPDALVPASARRRELDYLDRMFDAGCTAIDVAASYQLGGTERLIGDWMSSRRNRDRLFLITKGGHPYPVVQPHRLTTKALTGDLHASLRRLRTEQIDLYLLHKDDPGCPLEPLLELLSSFQRQGHIRAWGVSNWTCDRIRALNLLARRSALPTIAASSPHFSLLEWTTAPWTGSVSITGEANEEARAFHLSTQLPVLAWSPLGRGFFGNASTSVPNADGGTYGTQANLARRERAQRLARKYEITAAQVALAYLFSQPFPVFAVVASRTPEKMRDNLAVSALRLSKNEVRWLEIGGDPLPSLGDP